MALNKYFASGVVQGESYEQDIFEDSIIESIQINGVEVHYIPRTLVAKDEILGEDRLSKFENAYPIEMYFESVDGFDGQGAFLDKFGLMMEQQATLVVSKKRWAQVVGAAGTSILPNRPAEGDLIYFPLNKGLFEIMFVQHQDPFYQVNKQYVYKLQVELMKYNSEKIDTGNTDIDVFETLKSYDETVNADVDVPDSFGDNNKFASEAVDIVFNENNPFND